MDFRPHFLATAVGSTPHREAAEAVKEVLVNFKQIPFWPQLPHRAFLESMYVQFSEQLPGILVDAEKRTIYLDTEQAEKQLEKFYQHYLSDDTDYFAISPEYAPGFYALLETLKEYEMRNTIYLPAGRQGDIRYIKGQITGPVSFGLTVTDEHKRAIIYNPLLAEALIKVLTMKAKWQIRKLNPELRRVQGCPEPSVVRGKVIIFIDEPYLASVGSAYVNLKKEDIIRYSDEIIEAIHAEGALAGIHCCGNTDWSIILDTKTDIVSFDAYNFMDSFLLHTEKLKDFFEQGRVLAWGIVPASGNVDRETAESLSQRLEKGIGRLGEKGMDVARIASSSLITPSCGVGTLSIKTAKTVFELTRRLSGIMQTLRLNLK